MSIDPRVATASTDGSRALEESEFVLVVDWLRCAGHGVCAAAFGERIGRDDWGYPIGVTARGIAIRPADRGAARTAVSTCPAAALRLRRSSSPRAI